MHRARVKRYDYSQGWSEPHHRWVFECHDVQFNGHNSYVMICGEGTYTTFGRAWKCLRQHALGKHDFVL